MKKTKEITDSFILQEISDPYIADLIVHNSKDVSDKISIPVVFAMLALPCKELKDKNGKIATFEKIINKNNKRYTLSIKSGVLNKDEIQEDTTDKIYGIPYGTYAKLIYLYLFNQIKITKNKTVHLGCNYKEILLNLKIIKDGEVVSSKIRKSFNKQFLRIANCSLRCEVQTITKHNGYNITNVNQICFPFLKEVNSLEILKDNKNLGKGYFLTVSDEFYNMIVNNPFTIFDANLLHAFKRHPIAFNLAVYFSYWSFNSTVIAKKDLFVDYVSLYEQFGSSSTYKKFRDNLPKALSIINIKMPYLKLDISKKGILVKKGSQSSIRFTLNNIVDIAYEEKLCKVLNESKLPIT